MKGGSEGPYELSYWSNYSHFYSLGPGPGPGPAVSCRLLSNQPLSFSHSQRQSISLENKPAAQAAGADPPPLKLRQ